MEITIESTSVQSYLSSLQAVITRMASNSASSKTWCITIISAVLVFATDKDSPDAVWAAIAPVVLFFFLDAYYLGLERRFRLVYDSFVNKLQANTVDASDIFLMTPPGNPNTLTATLRAFTSLSVWPFYTGIILLLVIMRCWLF